MIAASGEIGIDVMVELCQSVLDGRGMPDEWALSVVVPIFKGKGDAMNCGAYRGVKLLEHAMKIVVSCRGRVKLELSEEFEVKVGVHQGSALSPFLFEIVVDVITESVRNGLMSEMLYAD